MGPGRHVREDWPEMARAWTGLARLGGPDG
jgi:hypothetical protein